MSAVETRPFNSSSVDDIVAMAQGSCSTHMLVKKADNTLWAWGRNDYGAVGNGSAGGISLPAKVFK